MHRESRPAATNLRPRDWSPDAHQERPREDAYRLAATAQAEASKNPDAFSETARKYSEDVVTRDRGGSLGALRASELPPAFLDAVAALEPGQISEVIETPMGFHVLLLRRPPPSETLSGARIVVGYRSTVEATSDRTRAEALERATTLVGQARATADFDALARAESDNPDRERGGAMGVWTNREFAAENAAVVETLGALPEGGVSEPIDTPLGFQIVKRLPAGPVKEFAARMVKIPIGTVVSMTGNGPDPSSQSLAENAAHADAENIARTLRRDKGAFAKLTGERCCKKPERWADGHGDPRLTSALERIAVGELTSPIREHDSFVIAQRLDPELFSPPARPILGLPAPATMELEEIVRGSDSGQLSRELAELTTFVRGLGLTKEKEGLLVGQIEGFRGDLAAATTPEARLVAYRNKIGKIRGGLSESEYARMTSLFERWAASRILMPKG